MGVEENKEVVLKFMDSTLENPSLMDEILTDDFVLHNVGAGRDTDKENLKKSIQGIKETFPDLAIEKADIIIDGDKVATRQTWRATQKGAFANIAPTGRRVSFSRFTIFYLKKGKIIEAWTLVDQLSLYQQLGALPPTEEIGK